MLGKNRYTDNWHFLQMYTVKFQALFVCFISFPSRVCKGRKSWLGKSNFFLHIKDSNNYFLCFSLLILSSEFYVIKLSVTVLITCNCLCQNVNEKYFSLLFITFINIIIGLKFTNNWKEWHSCWARWPDPCHYEAGSHPEWRGCSHFGKCHFNTEHCKHLKISDYSSDATEQFKNNNSCAWKTAYIFIPFLFLDTLMPEFLQMIYFCRLLIAIFYVPIFWSDYTPLTDLFLGLTLMFGAFVQYCRKIPEGLSKNLF